VRAGTAISDSIGPSWLPNRRTAIAWLFQRGVCKTTKPSHLVNILGDNALVATNEGWLCEYRAKEDGSDPRRLVVVFSGLRIPGTGILGDRHVESTRQVDVPGRTIVPGLGDYAFAVIDSSGPEISPTVTLGRRCSTMTVHLDEDTIDASLCGGKYGSVADYPLLTALLRTILGDLARR
jgi:hypothetical protein